MLAEMGRILRKRLKIQARDDEGMKQGCEMVNRGGIPDTDVTTVGDGTQERRRGNRTEETDLCQTPCWVFYEHLLSLHHSVRWVDYPHFTDDAQRR